MWTPGLSSPLSSSSTHFSETSTFKPPQEPGRQTKSVQCGWVDSPPPVATGCKWLVSGCFEEGQLQSLVSTAIGRQTWKLHKFGIKVFCSAGRSASWVSYGVGRHFLRNFIAQIHTSNHRAKISSLWRLQSFLWIKHAALADLAPFEKEHFRMLASQNSPASSAKQLKKITKWISLKDMADTCTFTPGFPHQLSQLYHPFFMIFFLHARIGMLQLRLEQIQHGAGRLGPWKNNVTKDVWQFIQQWLQSYNSGSGCGGALIFIHHDCGPRQLDHIWQASDGVGILRWNTVVTPDCHSMNTSRDSRKFKQPGSWSHHSHWSVSCDEFHKCTGNHSFQVYLLSSRHYSVSWQIRQPFASSQETCRPQRSSCPSQQHDGEETKRRWHILHEKTEDKSFSRHRFQFDTTPIRLLRVAPMPNIPNIWTDFCHWESGHLIVGFSSKKDLSSCQLKHRRAWQATRQQASTSGMGFYTVYTVYSLYIERKWLIYRIIIHNPLKCVGLSTASSDPWLSFSNPNFATACAPHVDAHIIGDSQHNLWSTIVSRLQVPGATSRKASRWVWYLTRCLFSFRANLNT